MKIPQTAIELVSRVEADGSLCVELIDQAVPQPAADEVLIRVEATPINPSDIGLLFGAADLSTLNADPGGRSIRARIPAAAMAAMKGRLGQDMRVGNEGAGTVVAAGESAAAQALLGRTVAVLAGGMYTRFRCVRAADCVELPAGTRADEAASAFVNPLTALGMVETMRREGHAALIHTAAASNLGRMLNRIGIADGVPMIHVVRRSEQVRQLKSEGATWVCDSSSPDFDAELVDAITATGATIAFDAIGGGRLAGRLLAAMEAALLRRGGAYSRYGTSVLKQVYIYGGLDLSPTEFGRGFGMSWAMGGWLLFNFLGRIGPEAAQALKRRVVAELKTTFASGYAQKISLSGALAPEAIARYAQRGTGAKFLIDPSLDD